jgi:hypothetical protein
MPSLFSFEQIMRHGRLDKRPIEQELNLVTLREISAATVSAIEAVKKVVASNGLQSGG